MPSASFIQTSFLGGEWSVYGQGRGDLEQYRTACNLCYNYIPLEVGAATRRPGTTFCATTRNGAAGVLRQFHFSQNAPYNMEFTDGHMRLFAGRSLLLQLQHVVATISAANPAVVGTPVAHGYTTGDQVQFNATPVPGTSPLGPAPLFNRQFAITVTDTQHFSLADPVTGATIDGSTINITGWNVTVARVVDFATSYTGGIWSSIRIVQDENTAFVLQGTVKPYVLTSTLSPSGTGTNDATFTFGLATFLDGPYLDPPTDLSTLTPSAVSGAITLTASALTSINGGTGFKATDVGRHVRLLSEPLDWSSGSAYVAGNPVRFETGAGPAYYQALVSNTNIRPDLDNGTNWAISTTAAAWTWAIITTFTDTSHVIATLQASATDIYQQPMAGGSLLYTNPVKVWRLGVYCDTTGYPTVGCFNGGRFFFAGTTGNRFDTTMSNDNFRFSPTLLDGTVTDNCGMSESLKGEDINRPLWLLPAAEGVIIGTQGGEWLVQASTLNEPLTPTSIDAKKVTRYGCANVEPRNTGLAYVFVQRYQKQVFEFLADVYSRKFQGTNIARKAKHLTGGNVVEIAYQAETAPVVWARTAAGRLLGCTYKRETPFSTQPASFMGWHQHALGNGRVVESLRDGPSLDGTLDAVMMVTNDPATNIRYVELMTPIFEETSKITDAWFLDAAVAPTSAEVKTVNSVLSVVFYGLQYIAGKTISAWFAGVDAGDFLVSATGTVTIPLDGSANGLLLPALLATMTTQGGFGKLAVSILSSAAGQGFFSPVGSALTYISNANAALHYARGNFDWDGGFLYAEQAQVGGDPGSNGHSLFIFNLVTRAQVAGPLDPGRLAFAASNYGTCMGYDGNIYFTALDGAHQFGRYNTATRASDLNYAVGDIESCAYVAPLQFGTAQVLVTTSLGSGLTAGNGGRVYVLNMTASGGPVNMGGAMRVVEYGSSGPGNAFPVRGPKGSAFVVSVGFTLGGDISRIGVYRVSVDGLATDGSTVGMVKIGQLIPTNVDAGWTSINIPVTPGTIYDETDGNLIMLVQGSDSTLRLIKINTTTAAVMWKITVTASVDFRTTRVRGGRFSYMDQIAGPQNVIRTIDTIAGTSVTVNENVLGPAEFSSDDKTGQVVVGINDIGTTDWATFGPAAGGGTLIPAGYYTAPAVLGFNYTSKLQILRPIAGQELQTPQGPAQGKTRRAHMHATLLANTQGVQFGTDFAAGKMHAARLVSAGRTVTLANNVLFTGTIQDTLDDTYSFDSMWATQTVRPYPTNIVSVECFVHTQER